MFLRPGSAILCMISCATLVAAVAGCANSPPFTVEADAIEAPLLAAVGNAAAGRQIFVDRDAGHCVLCHEVAGLDAPFQGNLGPALTGVGARLTPGQIRLRIVDASRLNPATVMPPYYRSSGLEQVAAGYRNETVLSARQIEHLVAWLQSLGREEAGG